MRITSANPNSQLGAVDYECRAWVNGKEVNRRYGGSVSFSFEISGAVKEGDNDLVVYAFDDVLSDVQPSGKQSTRPEAFGVFYTRVTGIWQTVWLEARPRQLKRRVNSQHRRYDVAVVGAGPAGFTAAYLLSRLGISAVLIDKAAFPRQKLCGGLLTLKTVRFLERSGSPTRMPSGDGLRAEAPVFIGLSDR